MLKGYKYTTETEAITDVTQHWIDYNYAELDGFWYITYDESLLPILGEPTEFELILPEQNV